VIAGKPMRHELTRAGVLISRFSTVPFEAMARGVPFVYHNPHGERVTTFARPAGAFEVTRDADQLAGAVARALGPGGRDYRSTARDFFLRQVDVDDARRSEQRAADVVEDALGR
jgi:hypothetical protein